MNRTATISAVAVALVAAAFCIHSIYLGLSLERSMPIFDQIMVTTDYFRLLDGDYSPLELLDQHNEHRIATTRILLFADAYLFSMAGYLPLFTAYAASAATAWIIAITAAGNRSASRIAVFGLATALLWSTMNWTALGIAFQVCFPLLHLFAAAAFLFFARERSLRNLVLACVADALAVYSLGSGVFVVVPIVAISFWMRRVDRWLAAFLVVHALLVAAYFFSFTSAPPTVAPDVRAFWRTLLDVVGWMAVTTEWQDTLGLWTFIGCALFLGAATCRVAYAMKPVAADDCVLLALILFTLLECMAAAFNRVLAANPRYADFAAILFAATLALLWRHTDFFRRFQRAAQVAVVVTAVSTVVLANQPVHVSEWRKYAASTERVETAVRRGDRSEEILAILWPPGHFDIDGFLDRMAAEHLGPFRRGLLPPDRRTVAN